MITFILNNSLIKTEKTPGIPLLDFIRTEMDLSGTKVGCREGDCGACTVMAGELVSNRMVYKTLVSCLTPLANVQGKHIVTIEGLRLDQDALSPVQEAIVDHSATQCGFCSPGFVVSLTAHGLGDGGADPDAVLQAISGNICRCTGYKSIERAARDIASLYAAQGEEQGNGLDWMVTRGFLPDWFTAIPQRLAAISDAPSSADTGLILAGGTDLLVQQPDTVLQEDDLRLFACRTDLQTIEVAEGCCTLGAAVTTAEIMDSAIIRNAFPAIRNHFKLISSPSIRNVATLAGNIINGSPIADLSVFFLALDADVLLSDAAGTVRQLPLREFFVGYKQQQIRAGEIIQAVRFQLPVNPDTEKFNFEKIGKRQHLDIASVNSAIGLRVDDTVLSNVHLSAGGVAPIPLYLRKTSSFLTGRIVNRQTVVQANAIMQEEIAPMSDIRGSKAYKRLLLRQLLYAHFLTLFPEILSPEMLLQERTA
jgi:xanthine dehydrogenase small subunit